METKERRAWMNMKDRCNNPRHKAFHNYGARGIVVCERWLSSFETFLEDMGFAPTKNHQLDRIDNNKGYYPRNCQWRTAKEQGNNRRTNHFLTLNDTTKTIADWAIVTGIKVSTISRRIKHGWSIKNALSIRPIQEYEKKKINGKYVKFNMEKEREA